MLAEGHVSEFLPAYALDCLSQEETLVVGQHLSQCQQCQEELAAYQRIVNALPQAIPLASPPAELKKRIMDGLPGHPAHAAAARPRVDSRRIWSWLQRLAPAAAFVSFLLVIVLAAGVIWQFQRIRRLEALTPANFGVIKLTGTNNAPLASGLLVISRDGSLGTLVVDNLPRLDSAHQYQLWLMHDNQRTNGGVFSVSGDGYGALTIHSPMPLVTYNRFGITIEPIGGSTGPTGAKVLGGGS